MRRRRAVLFDLDDTLYPLSQFARSGFRAVARHLEHTRGIERHRTIAALDHAAAGPNRGRELQALAERFDLPARSVRELVKVIRAHRPILRLPRQTVEMLRQLRSLWRLGIVTNGIPAMQARKVEALGVAAFVDVVVYASDYGTGAGKPESAPFLAALGRLGVDPGRAVFVGNDERCDIEGAAGVGMHTVWYATEDPRPQSQHASAVIGSLLDVPRVAEALVETGAVRGSRHVA